MAHWEALLPGRSLTVPYEALVGDQAGFPAEPRIPLSAFLSLTLKALWATNHDGGFLGQHDA